VPGRVTGFAELLPLAEDSRPRLFVMAGLPGSGKTTLARERFSAALRVSLDDLRLMLSGRSFDARFEAAVSAAGEAATRALLARAAEWHADVLFDATSVTRKLRARSLALAAQYGALPICVHVDCPLELALARNSRRRFPVPEEVIRGFRATLETPDVAEGFAAIITVRIG